jgi:hypothetical protein
MTKDSIESNGFIHKKISQYSVKNSDFSTLDIDKITIYELQNRVSKEYYKLENVRTNYLDNTFSHYKLGDKQKEKLEKKISKKSVKDLNKLINLESENDKFLNKIFGENKIDKISDFTFLDSLSKEDIKDRLEKLSE